MFHTKTPIALTLFVFLAGCNGAKFSADAPPRANLISKSADSTKEEAPPTVTPPPEAPVAQVEAPVAEPTTEPITSEPSELPPTPPSTPVVTVPAPAPIPSVPLTETITVEETQTQQGLNGLVDIAIVIDDSSSMNEEQANLSTKLNDLIVSLKDANWQIGVVTTTQKTDLLGNDRCDLTLIKPTDADMEAKFVKAVSAGTGGSGNEQGILQMVTALKCPQKPWVRPNSTIAVLIVSDEDNCSNEGSDCPTSPARTEQYAIDYVEKDLKRVVGKNAAFYGIFAPPGEECKTAGSKGFQYQRLVDYKADGAINYGNICDASYKKTLERISKNIAKLLSAQFTVKQTPDSGSVVIIGMKSNGDAITAADYTVMGNVVTFKAGSEPALGSDIVLTYKVTTTKPL